MGGEIFTQAVSVVISSLVTKVERSLVDEDEAIISRGVGMNTKQELQELEDHINYASFLLAAGVVDNSHPEPIEQRIDQRTEARVEMPTEQRTEGRVEVPTERSIRQPTEQRTEEPIEQRIGQRTEEPIEQRIEEPTEQRNEDRVEVPTEHRIGQRTEEPTERSIGQPTEQRTEEPIEQRTEEPVERRIGHWISEARKTAFCLEDQIAMYVIRGSSNSQLLHMKYDIGKLRIEELTKSIKRHNTLWREGLMHEVQRSPDSMPQLSKMSFFIHRIPSVPAHAVIRMDDKIKKIEAFFAGPQSVLFITGGQGSGKTTLMEDVYKKRKKAVHGTDQKCCWVDIAETAGLGSLLKKVLKKSGVDCDSTHEFQLIHMVRDTLKDKHCLIVLDNVDDTSVLYSLMFILENLKWKIICLTRTADIQEDKNQDVLRLHGLEPYDSLDLLLRAAFCHFNSTILQRRNFNSTVRDDVLHEAIRWKYSRSPSALQSDQEVKMVKLLNDILSKCQGNPSNISSIGTLLQDDLLENLEKIEEWVDGMLIDGAKIYEKRDPHIQFEDATLADAATRHCLLYCLAFPETSQSSETMENSGGIPRRKLIRYWTAEGYVQDSGNQTEEQAAECMLDKLIMKNLLVVKKIGFDGKVLKCSVNEHIRPLAENMCEQQKFCKVVADDADDSSAPSRMTRSFPISPIILRRMKKNPLLDRYRMLAVHGDRGVKEIPKALGKDIRLRSLLHFKTGRLEQSKLKLSFGRTYMLLRTLELQGARLAKLSLRIDCLVCLRYLGLRNTQLKDLPPTLKKLTQLMCLDIRDNNIAEVVDVSQFEQMRHLYLTNSFRSHSVAIREGLQSLIRLQTLSGAAYGESSENMSFEEQISHLRHLRKLSMKKAPSTSSHNICNVINKIEPLQSLALSCNSDGQQFDLTTLNIGENLRKLKLGGPICNFFNQDQLKQMQSITFLYLWDSKLPNDPDLLHTLQGLTSLLVLSLLNTSMSEVMICDGGYKKLKKLSIISMENLSECRFAQNAMGNLEELVFAKCGRLERLPQGLGQLGHLREVHLTEMLPGFCKEAKDKLGDKVHVLRDALSHVVSSRAATGGGS